MQAKLTSHPFADARNAAALALGLWTLGVGLVAAGGKLARQPADVIAALVVAAVLVAIAAVRLDVRLRDWLATIDPRTFTAFNAWRLPAGLAFLAAGSQGLLPASFALVAGWGDIVVGVAALALTAVRAGPRAHYAFQFLGLADFALAVGLGLAHTVRETPLMENIATLPLAFIALVGVPVTAAVHVAAIASLARRLRAGTAASPAPVARALATSRASR
jgi:hypothetical protein